ncbi:MAG: putative 4-hydroxybenzoate polyprenyltransferase [Caldilineales bacterium]|nr:putative 4-hydroxybenzoate polyprenyltransferase [Caldilineales bacterium]MCW5860748.1 putative 4-hydroxybenzoate polyprenyltransferase [Caldilineales bacterium]
MSARPVRTFLEMIKFEHTVFALPFAYLGMALAWAQTGAFVAPVAWATLFWQFVWITVAMAAARTAAMAFNRAIDAEIDARNPRTAGRPIQTGRISQRAVWLAGFVSLGVMLFAAWQLNTFVLLLSPLAVLGLLGYAYTKRFTWLCHLWLGLVDGAAAAGAWAAVTGDLAGPIPWLLWAAVAVWIGGFDLIYACQDVEIDRREGLHSLPARFGIPVALRLAQIAHVLTVILLAGVGIVAGLGWPYWLGLVVVAGLLVYEHSLVKPDDLSKVNLAFFTMNGYISVITLLATVLGLWLG